MLVELLRKDATEIHRTLGYHINIADNNTEATNMHIANVKQINNAVLRSVLSTQQKKWHIKPS